MGGRPPAKTPADRTARAGTSPGQFPFYYLIVGSLQREPDTTPAAAFPPIQQTFANYAAINKQVNPLRTC